MVGADKYDTFVVRFLDQWIGQGSGIVILGAGAALCVTAWAFFKWMHAAEFGKEQRDD